MTRYKLKKDLPFAKAGNEVVVLASPITRYKRIQVSNSLSAPMCELHEDQVSLWIEEVKPREFWVSKHYATVPNSDYGKLGDWTVSEEQPMACGGRCIHIKVREVENE